MENFTDNLSDIIFIIIALSVCILFIGAIIAEFKNKNKKEVIKENQELRLKIQNLESQIETQESQLIYYEKYIASEQPQNLSSNHLLLNLNSLKIKAENISYIVSQNFIQYEHGDSRIKVINYINSLKTDSVYGSFDMIIEQMPSYFMAINKNQIVNLKQIYKIQNNEIFLENIKTSFTISETKKDEFDLRIKKL